MANRKKINKEEVEAYIISNLKTEGYNAIADKFNVSAKTIYTIVTKLSERGVYVEWPDRGQKVMKVKYTPLPIPSKEELRERRLRYSIGKEPINVNELISKR